jgi:hypothetical protein
MAGHGVRCAAGAVLGALLAAGAVGCTGDDSPSGAASKAASVLESVGSQASSAASRAASAVASATAEARRRLDAVKDGVDAKDEVRSGKPATDGDGRTTVTVTARNTDDTARSFAVQVDFRDRDGNLLDAVVVTVPDVAAGESGEATARSTRKLSGDVRAEVGRALRY